MRCTPVLPTEVAVVTELLVGGGEVITTDVTSGRLVEVSPVRLGELHR